MQKEHFCSGWLGNVPFEQAMHSLPLNTSLTKHWDAIEVDSSRELIVKLLHESV